VEKLSDHVTPEHSQAIKVVKDLGSAAVMLTLTAAFLIWASAIAARLWW
jgi:diacylglycerol kinase